VVPDTSILWHEDKGHAVCPEFDQFWDAHSGHISLELVIPSTVIGELHFQQTTSALKAVDRITESMSVLSKVSTANYRHRIDGGTVTRQVGTKLSKWLASKGGKIVDVPLGAIDWASVVEAAVWRKPPFTFDSKNPDQEKGFRDCLILETLSQIARDNDGTNKNVVFLCNDALLRATAEARLKDRPNALFFESLPDFASYIKLSSEALTNTFVRQIQVHARAKFYAKDDPTCIYRKQAIPKLVVEKFEDTLKNPDRLVSTGLLAFPIFSTSGASSHWEQISRGFRIGPTQFTKLVPAREFYWTSRVTLRVLYKQSSPTFGTGIVMSAMGGVVPVTERLLLLAVDIAWKANVKADGRFHNIELVSTDLVSESFDVATPELLQKWTPKS
jgi:hypothetical protein